METALAAQCLAVGIRNWQNYKSPGSPPGTSVQGDSPGKNSGWVAIPSSRGSSWPRDGTHFSYVSCIASGFFTTELPGKPLVRRITRTHFDSQFSRFVYLCFCVSFCVASWWTQFCRLSCSSVHIKNTFPPQSGLFLYRISQFVWAPCWRWGDFVGFYLSGNWFIGELVSCGELPGWN